jgi:hypothetical protein
VASETLQKISYSCPIVDCRFLELDGLSPNTDWQLETLMSPEKFSVSAKSPSHSVSTPRVPQGSNLADSWRMHGGSFDFIQPVQACTEV